MCSFAGKVFNRSWRADTPDKLSETTKVKARNAVTNAHKFLTDRGLPYVLHTLRQQILNRTLMAGATFSAEQPQKQSGRKRGARKALKEN
jgi:hypothetical protein